MMKIIHSKKKWNLIYLLGLLLSVSQMILGQQDPYGGWLSVPSQPTGFFYISEIKGRHTLISPAGHAYYPMGINHLSAYDNQVYKHIDAFQEGETALKKIKADLEILNMNSGGGDCPEIIQDQIPFFITIRLTNNAHWLPATKFEFQDVFEQAYLDELKDRISNICSAYLHNKYLIGYYWTDTPRWDVAISRQRHLKDWVSQLRNLPGTAPGKQQYVEFLRQKYQTIGSFNQRYGLDFASFEDLLEARFDHIDFNQSFVIKDDTEFLGIIADHLYHFASKTIKELDPNRLILGEKYKAGDHPDPVLKAASKYVDVISIQPGPEKGPGPGAGKEERVFNEPNFRWIYQLTKKPILICDHAVSFYTEENPVTLWHQFATEEEAGAVTENYIGRMAAQPYIIGYHRCQYLDYYDPHRGLLKQGLLDRNGEFHQELTNYISRANKEALEFVRKALE